MATRRVPPTLPSTTSTASSSSVLSTSKSKGLVENQNQTSRAAGKVVIDTIPGNNKNIIRRTRNALGDIGNRLTNKGVNGKKEDVKKPTKPVKIAVPAPTAAAGRIASTLIRNNTSAMGGGSSNLGSSMSFRNITSHLKNSKPTVSRVQSFQSTVGSKKGNIPSTSVTETSRLVNNKVVKPVASTSVWKVVDPAEEVKQKENIEPVPVPLPSVDAKAIDELTEAFSLQRFIPDIDEDDAGPNGAREYVKDISRYLFCLEKKHPIKENYLTGRNVNGRMRAVLMDWLVEVHNQFGYCAETLYLTAKTLDRYLQSEYRVTRTQLQLVGMTSMYLATKYEEVMSPNISDFVGVADNTFTIDNIKQMEVQMLKTLEFDLSSPQPVFFLRRCSKAAQVTSAQFNRHQLAKYIMELSLVDYDAVQLFPSQIAAGAYGVAAMILDKQHPSVMWTPTLEYYGGYSVEELKPAFKLLTLALARAYEQPNKLQAVTNKYARSRAYRISKHPEVQAVGSWKTRILADLESMGKN